MCNGLKHALNLESSDKPKVYHWHQSAIFQEYHPKIPLLIQQMTP
ncbi:hypothetical protein [Rubritalea tangerina]